MSRAMVGWLCAAIYVEVSAALGLWLAGLLPWGVALAMVMLGTCGLAESTPA